MFRGRYNRELYSEYARWLPYITDLFLPCCDSETGDFRILPFPGSASDQPYMTMQIMKVIQLNYRMVVAEKNKAMASKR